MYWAITLLVVANLSLSIDAAGFVPPPKPDYAQLEEVSPSRISEDPEFKRVCTEMAGYYKDSSKNKSLAKTLLMAGMNFSYKDFYHNFKCFADRIGVKFLPVALDSNIYEYLKDTAKVNTYLMPDLDGREKVPTKASGFGGKYFNLIGCRKIEAVAGALKLGYDVIFSDVDIALMRDPINYLFFPGVDYVHSENNGCNKKWSFNDTMEGNTGFYSVKSNPQTIRTWDLSFRSCSLTPLYDDQTMFWLILRTNLNPSPEPRKSCPAPGDSHKRKSNSTVVTCPLDSCMFSAGSLREGNPYQTLLKALKAKKQPAVMAHANWMNGREKKKAALTRAGLWIAQGPGGLPPSKASNVNNPFPNHPYHTRHGPKRITGPKPRPKTKPGNRALQESSAVAAPAEGAADGVSTAAPPKDGGWTCREPSSKLLNIHG